MSSAQREVATGGALSARIPTSFDPEVLRSALASAGLGVFELATGSCAFHWDSRCKALLGITDDRSAVEEFLACVHTDDRERIRPSIVGLVERAARERDYHDEFRCLDRKDDPKNGGPRRLEMRGSVVLDPQGHPQSFVGTLREVTEQRHVEQEREQRIDELSRTVRFSEMFVGILAHDLRNPLSGMMMAAQLAARRATDEALVPVLGRVVTSGERIGRMIDQLLDFTCARVGSGIPLHLHPVDLMTVARDVVAELSDARPEWKLTLEGVGVTTGSWDGDRIAQVLSNLIGNGVQHGIVEHGLQVRVDGSGPDDVSLEVHNQGLIPPELMLILFNPFRAVHQKRDRSRGLGLGLYVTRQIAVAHGGGVEVESTEAGGTTFRVRLPRRPSAATLPKVPDEMLALERFASPSPATATTAQLFGAVPLDQRAPRAYWQIFEQYGGLLDAAVERAAFKESPHELADSSGELKTIAERLGVLNAGAREVAELHARALRQRTRGVVAAKAQALVTEGRLMAFELMGHLLSFYRRRAGFSPGGESAP